MAKKQSSKKRAKVNDLPRKEKKLSAAEAKRVKGGGFGVEREMKESGEKGGTEDISSRTAVVSLGKLG